MVVMQNDVQIEIICYKCGDVIDYAAELTVDYSQGLHCHKIRISPCMKCLAEKYNQGLKEGQNIKYSEQRG